MFARKIILVELTFFAASLTTAGSARAAQKKYHAKGDLFGRPFSTQVDGEPAATMLANRQDSSVVILFASGRSAELSSSLPEHIAKEYSPDVSTLSLVERLYGQAKNKQLQDYYLSAALPSDLSCKRRKQDAQAIDIPESMYTISVITARLGQKQNRAGIATPNDGYSPLPDEIVGGSDVVVEVGSDHTLERLDLNTRMAALLRCIIRQRKGCVPEPEQMKQNLTIQN